MGGVDCAARGRQQGHVRDDLMLAKWFAGDEIPEGFDDVRKRIRRGDKMPSLRAVAWEVRSPEQVIDDVLATNSVCARAMTAVRSRHRTERQSTRT